MKETVAKDGGLTSAPWIDAPVPASGFDLIDGTTCDACVVGAGIAGLSVAHELTAAGLRVIVLDDGPIGGGETARTSAHLASALDDHYYLLESLHGERGARLAAASHVAAIDRVEQLARELSIDCDFRRIDGYLFVPPGGDRRELERELAAARRVGLTCEMVGTPFPHFDVGPCLRFADQARFHPLAYLAGLARAVLAAGGAIHTGVRVESVDDGEPVKITCADGRVVTAGVAVVATNTPMNDRVAMHTKQAPYRTYLVGLEMPPGAVPDALLWDTGDPYHYLRIIERVGQRPLLLVGGEDHKTGQADDADVRYDRLEAWARERVPDLGARVHWWSGQVIEPMDGLAFIGKNPGDDKVHIVTGDSGNGLTHGVIAGMLIRDLVTGADSEWATLYDPARKNPAGLGSFLKENLNVAMQYGDWLTGGEVESVDDIAAGEGAVVRRGLRKIAVYRDDRGELHQCSATCPHLGGVVGWNSSEKTWDCPAHGSRFDAFGRCVNGPAATDLERLDAGDGAPRAEGSAVRTFDGDATAGGPAAPDLEQRDAPDAGRPVDPGRLDAKDIGRREGHGPGAG